MSPPLKLAILGSTGSIGRQTLEVVRAFPGRFQVFALAAGHNAELLARQAQEFRPRFISLERGTPEGRCPEVLEGVASLSPEEMACHPEIDLVVVATSGKVGLKPTLAALAAGKGLALANKEVLVMAGAIVMGEARRHGVEVRPIDSEHSALWQCLRGEEGGVRRLILTASGGPFRLRSPAELATVTPEAALRHPTWQMGPKVTIDSATLMNKGFEAIEARWLFDIPLDRVDIVLHPQSIVHSLVEFQDGSVKAQLSLPDMRLPIQYALTYPERWPRQNTLDLSRVSPLTFEALDLARFPCLRLALEAGRQGQTYPAVLSAADEVAVALFLGHRLGFLDIPRLVEHTLGRHQPTPEADLAAILEADAWAREEAQRWARGRTP